MNSIPVLTPQHWKEYRLIDSGNFEKLEQFGAYVTSRPEPQAAWDKSLKEEEWQKKAHAQFKKEKNNPEKGQWEILKPGLRTNDWFIQYQSANLNLKLKLSLSSFKHVGIFPEQAENWEYIFEKVRKMPVQSAKVLNLFAYTGGASLAARQAGAEVTHLDSVKQVVSWARENMEASRLDNIRWMVEDALKFVKREIRRGNTYHGILLDPPAYGRGPEGEKWILEEQINEMLKTCDQLLVKEHHFVLINLYSLGFSSLILNNLLDCCFEKTENREVGELCLEDTFGKKLPLGVFGRFYG